MKKITAIFIGIVFIVAFLFIGFLGNEIKVGDPTVYVTNIVWNTEEFKDQKDIKIEKFENIDHEKDKDNEGGIQYDAVLKYRTASLGVGKKFNIKCLANPAEADDTTLKYYMEESNSFTYKTLKDNTCDITFKEGGSYTLYVIAQGGKGVKYYINFEIIDFSEF